MMNLFLGCCLRRCCRSASVQMNVKAGDINGREVANLTHHSSNAAAAVKVTAAAGALATDPLPVPSDISRAVSRVSEGPSAPVAPADGSQQIVADAAAAAIGQAPTFFSKETHQRFVAHSTESCKTFQQFCSEFDNLIEEVNSKSREIVQNHDLYYNESSVMKVIKESTGWRKEISYDFLKKEGKLMLKVTALWLLKQFDWFNTRSKGKTLSRDERAMVLHRLKLVQESISKLENLYYLCGNAQNLRSLIKKLAPSELSHGNFSIFVNSQKRLVRVSLLPFFDNVMATRKLIREHKLSTKTVSELSILASCINTARLPFPVHDLTKIEIMEIAPSIRYLHLVIPPSNLIWQDGNFLAQFKRMEVLILPGIEEKRRHNRRGGFTTVLPLGMTQLRKLDVGYSVQSLPSNIFALQSLKCCDIENFDLCSLKSVKILHCSPDIKCSKMDPLGKIEVEELHLVYRRDMKNLGPNIPIIDFSKLKKLVITKVERPFSRTDWDLSNMDLRSLETLEFRFRRHGNGIHLTLPFGMNALRVIDLRDVNIDSFTKPEDLPTTVQIWSREPKFQWGLQPEEEKGAAAAASASDRPLLESDPPPVLDPRVTHGPGDGTMVVRGL